MGGLKLQHSFVLSLKWLVMLILTRGPDTVAPSAGTPRTAGYNNQRRSASAKKLREAEGKSLWSMSRLPVLMCGFKEGSTPCSFLVGP